MKIAIAQINSMIADFERNLENILHFIDQARTDEASLVVFPELAISGYPPQDLLNDEAFILKEQQTLSALQKSMPDDIAVAIGHVASNTPQHSNRHLHNAISVYLNGTLLHYQAKTLLPTYDVFDEKRYFDPSTSHTIFTYQDIRFGIAICEDIWNRRIEPDIPGAIDYSVNPIELLLHQMADIILIPSASPYEDHKPTIRRHLLKRISEKNGVAVIYINAIGANDSLIFDGRSMIFDRYGQLIEQGEAFKQQLLIIEAEDIIGKNKKYVAIERALEPINRRLLAEDYEDIESALTLGIADYIRKNGFRQVILGLSGGIDSAIVAVIASRALGAENVCALIMPSCYSSIDSVTDARDLAKRLGIRAIVVSIERLRVVVEEELAPLFDLSNEQMENTASQSNLTAENIQARLRGLILMAYSNRYNQLLLNTGNKSELAVGYSTLYGDLCGSLSVIGDLFKTEVYRLARHFNREQICIPPSIIDKHPSAELRFDQKDADSLPPYHILDKILALHLLENRSVDYIADTGIDRQLVKSILNMTQTAEFKRRQAPPILKVSRRAFGDGRRIPITRARYDGEKCDSSKR